MAVLAGKTARDACRCDCGSRRRIQVEVGPMETFLVVITIVAVAVAVAAFTAMRRVQRAERQRSEARVAALSAAAEVHGATDGGWKQVGGEWQWVASPWSFADQEPRTKEQGLSSAPAAASAPAIA